MITIQQNTTMTVYNSNRNLTLTLITTLTLYRNFDYPIHIPTYKTLLNDLC